MPTWFTHSSGLLSPSRLVILSMPRSGSTYFTAAIDSNPGFRVLVEPLNHYRHGHHMQPPIGDPVVPAYMLYNQLEKVLFDMFCKKPLPSIYNTKYDQHAGVCAGFKIMAHQIIGLPNEKVFWTVLKELDVKVIRYYRHNILKQIISDLIAMKTRQPVAYKRDTEGVKTARVTVDVKLIESAMIEIRKYRAHMDTKVQEYQLDNRMIVYEDISEDLQKINDYMPWLIGRTVTSFKERTIRQNPESIKDRVFNYGELVKTCERLHLMSFLKDT